MVETDAAIVAAVVAGDTEAFGGLVERYHYAAEQWAFAHLRSWWEVQAVVQDAFVEAYRRLPGLREPARFGAWLRSIVVHRAIDRGRRRQHRVSLDGMLDAYGDGALRADSRLVVHDTPFDHVAQQQDEQTLRQALAALPAADRAVVERFYLEGLSYQQIADQDGTSMPAVRSRLHRARQTLKQEVERRGRR